MPVTHPHSQAFKGRLYNMQRPELADTPAGEANYQQAARRGLGPMLRASARSAAAARAGVPVPILLQWATTIVLEGVCPRLNPDGTRADVDDPCTVKERIDTFKTLLPYVAPPPAREEHAALESLAIAADEVEAQGGLAKESLARMSDAELREALAAADAEVIEHTRLAAPANPDHSHPPQA